MPEIKVTVTDINKEWIALWNSEDRDKLPVYDPRASSVQLMEYIGAIEQTLDKEAKKEFLPMQPGDVA